MKTRRWMLWLVMAILLLSTVAAQAGFGSWWYHNIYGYRGYWTFRYHSVNYTYFKIDVPANCASLTIQAGDTHGGYGDCDVYVRYGALPTSSTYTRRSTGNSYTEKIVISNPSAGRWYVKLWGYSNYRSCLKLTTVARSTSYNWRTDMLNRVNYYRGQYGRTALVQNSLLQAAAQNYAYDQASKNYYGGSDHHGSTSANWTMSNRINATGYGWSYICENIAAGQTTVAEVMTTWWNSSGHKANILNSSIRQAGFGYSYNANASYRTRWVQDYALPR